MAVAVAPSYQTVPRLVRCAFTPAGAAADVDTAIFRVRDMRELALAVRRHAHPHLPGVVFTVDVRNPPAGRLLTPDGEVIGAFTMTTPPPADLHPAYQAAGGRLLDDGRAGGGVLIADSGAGGRHPVAWAATRIAAAIGHTITIVDSPALQRDWDALLAAYGPGLNVRHVTPLRIARNPDDVRDPAAVYVIAGDRVGERSKAFAALRSLLGDVGQPTLVYLHPAPRPATHILRAVYGPDTPAPARLHRAAAAAGPGETVPQVLPWASLETPR